MPLTIAITKETAADERRVAASPETVKKYVTAGHTVLIETVAGKAASFTDDAYKEAGATIGKTAAEIVAKADIILKVQAGDQTVLDNAKSGSTVIGLFNPLQNKDGAGNFAKRK